MPANEIHVGDIGTIFELTFTDGSALDVSEATNKQIVFQTADNRRLQKSASFGAQSGSDGKVRYATTEGDLSIAGKWKIQGVFSNADGTWHSDVTEFTVYPNL